MASVRPKCCSDEECKKFERGLAALFLFVAGCMALAVLYVAVSLLWAYRFLNHPERSLAEVVTAVITFWGGCAGAIVLLKQSRTDRTSRGESDTPDAADALLFLLAVAFFGPSLAAFAFVLTTAVATVLHGVFAWSAGAGGRQTAPVARAARPQTTVADHRDRHHQRIRGRTEAD